MCTTDFYL